MNATTAGMARQGTGDNRFEADMKKGTHCAFFSAMNRLLNLGACRNSRRLCGGEVRVFVARSRRRRCVGTATPKGRGHGKDGHDAQRPAIAFFTVKDG